MKAQTMMPRRIGRPMGAVLIFALFGLSLAQVPPGCDLRAPEKFSALFETSVGDFTIDVDRAYSPLGADRFYSLIQCGFYNTSYFFRVLPGFVVQFGLAGIPETDAIWRTARITDDPVLRSNTLGWVSFATSGANTRTTQIFINLGNNARLDAMGFSPFGFVNQAGMQTVLRIFSGYGETPNQARILSEGNAYLRATFPNLDYVTGTSLSPAGRLPDGGL